MKSVLYSDLHLLSALNWDAVSRATRPKSKTSVRAFSSKSRDNMDEVQTRFLSKVSMTEIIFNLKYMRILFEKFLF